MKRPISILSRRGITLPNLIFKKASWLCMSSKNEGAWASKLRIKITKAVEPVALEIVDESAYHEEHPEVVARGTKETHFRVTVVSEKFQNKSFVQRHRMIYDTLSEELSSHIHALTLTTETPEEYKARTEKGVNRSNCT